MSRKTDGMIKLALVFFVCLLSFSIGTYIGKKYSDNQHKLALLEPTLNSGTPDAHTARVSDEFATETEAMHQNNAAAHAETLLTDDSMGESADHSADDESAEQNVASLKPAALTDAEVAKLAAEFANEDAMEVTEKKVEKISEQDVKTTTAEQRIPASIPAKKPMVIETKKITELQYTVQIGSYPTEAEAEKMTNTLMAKGYKTSYVPANVNGRTWYRVSVGLFGSFREAQEYRQSFLEKTKLTSAIIQRVE